MMDKLDELAVLVAIVDEGSLAAAARRLRRSAPSMTRVLAALEARAGTRLLERTTRRLAPTEAGAALAARARTLLLDYSGALDDLASAPVRGLLRVAATVPFGRLHVSRIVNGFLAAYPDTRIDLVLDDRYVDLIDEGVDVAVRVGALPDSSLVARRVGSMRGVVVVGSPGYLKKRGTPQRPADLAKHDIIFANIHHRPSEWRLGSGARGAVARFTPRLSVNDVETQIAAARAGRGLARVLPYQIEADLKSGKLVPVLRAYEPVPEPVHLVTPGARVTPKVRAFLDYAMAEFMKIDAINIAVGKASRVTPQR
ncbi:MAG TPA: LysR family transcriptional regulator [Burkholderiales bacterium]|nr:LysR family transcriptional regulator [Burkholderiales bacterium]